MNSSRYDERGLQRLISLSDGIFAIAVTLAVFQLIPSDLSGALRQVGVIAFLKGLSSNLLSLVISFIVVGLYWLTHHRIFSHVKSAPRPLLILNLAFLFGITLVPFSTELLNSLSDDAVVIIYASNMAYIGLMLIGIWYYLLRHPTLHEFNQEELKIEGIRMTITPILFLISIGIAKFNHAGAEYFWCLIAFSRSFSRELTKLFLRPKRKRQSKKIAVAED